MGDLIGEAEHRVGIAPSGAVLAMTADETAEANAGWCASLTIAAAGCLTLAWSVFVISLAVRAVKWALS